MVANVSSLASQQERLIERVERDVLDMKSANTWSNLSTTLSRVLYPR